ncbi:MAG: hypothetical protein JRJ49_09940 [Deltaproteobacteria bacterium]|nr:hypothetical protein [Deltaproteobacteria bacterium]
MNCQQTLKILSKEIEFNEDEHKLFSSNFEYLNEDNINQKPCEKDDFFKGKIDCWGGYRLGWDFLRDIYIDDNNAGDKKICLKNRIKEELKDKKKMKIIAISGMPGCGKSMLGRRIAFDFYSSENYPVIFINNSFTTIDYKVISTFIETINNQLELGKDNSQICKPIIIFDDFCRSTPHIFRLKNWLQSRGRTALIVAIDRTNEITNNDNYKDKFEEKNIYEIDEGLNSSESKRIIEHLYNIKYVPTKNINWENIIKERYNHSFFATIYSLVHPSQKPLDIIIKDQYSELSQLAKDAYSYVCSFSQFNSSINIELLVRILKCSYDKFIKDIIKKDASKIIFQAKDEFGNLLFKAHHNIIAEKTLDIFYPDATQQHSIFVKIFENVNSGNLKELLLCENLIIEHLKFGYFSIAQRRELFKIACEIFPTKSLYHHWGLLEMKEQNYDKAESLLNYALEFQNVTEAYRGESDQNILTTMGTLYSNQGISELKQNNNKQADIFLKKAEDVFEKAKHGEFPNGHAYHSHAYMWFKKAVAENNNDNKMIYLGKALEISTLAKDNLNEEDLEIINELEIKIWNEIDDKTEIQKYIEILRDNYKSSKGYFLVALHKYYNAVKFDDEVLKLKELNNAIRKIEKGLKYFPADENLISLQCKVFKKIMTDQDYKIYYDYLTLWRNHASKENAILMYELGRTAFILKYYDISEKIFNELQENIGNGNSKRTRNLNPIQESGEKTVFNGEITRIYNKNEGNIKCSSLENLRKPIPFRPIAARFSPLQGNFVRFNIAFSFRGPYAVNLVKR